MADDGGFRHSGGARSEDVEQIVVAVAALRTGKRSGRRGIQKSVQILGPGRQRTRSGIEVVQGHWRVQLRAHLVHDVAEHGVVDDSLTVDDLHRVDQGIGLQVVVDERRDDTGFG